VPGGVLRAFLDQEESPATRLLVESEMLLKSAQQPTVAAELSAEIDNLRAAWGWAVEGQRLVQLDQMLPCLHWFHEVRNTLREAEAMFGRAVDELRQAGAPEQVSAFAHLLGQLGWFAFRVGKAERAAAWLQESLALARPHDDPRVLYHVHTSWGILALVTGDAAAARRLLLDSLAEARRLGHPWHIAAELEAQLTPLQIEAAQARAQVRTLDEVVKEMR